MINQQIIPVESCVEVARAIFRLTFRSAAIASSARPGQFVNVRVDHTSTFPLLRRPFSISRVEGDLVELLFSVVGPGTRRMAQKRTGDVLDVLGPLGKPFCLDHQFDTVLIVAGGLGVAPFPFLTDALRTSDRLVVSFVGARTASQLVRNHLRNVQAATDDGSEGFKGTVVECLDAFLSGTPVARPRIFGCGPTPMLRALSEFANAHNLPCELSLEGEMACGVGICQGCPVRRSRGEKKYALVCTEGPTFSATEIVL